MLSKVSSSTTSASKAVTGSNLKAFEDADMEDTSPSKPKKLIPVQLR
jgi:hypothetical protein